MNEVNLHRGRYPHLTAIECFVDGQILTDAVVNYLNGLLNNIVKSTTLFSTVEI